MRIAVAGTHRNGKTTLAEAAANVLRGFAFEPEPYEQLLESGVDFLNDRAPEAFVQQLDYLVARLSATGADDNIIFDRSPLDLVAYVMASDEHQLGQRSKSLDANILELAAQGIASLDLIVFLPLRPETTMHARRSFRRLADAYLCDILRTDLLGLLDGSRGPAVIEATGTTSRRLEKLLEAIRHLGWSL